MWRWASGSLIGTGHLQNDSLLQDAYVVRRLKDDVHIAMVADGAGSAKYGRYGAWLACRRILNKSKVALYDTNSLPSLDDFKYWIDEIRDEIRLHAKVRDCTPREFATTISGVLFNNETLCSFSVGDSAVVGRRNNDWEVLCWPENGEYASTTYFLTDDPEPRLKFEQKENLFDGFSVFTDGIGEIAISFNDGCAHKPFFDAMFRGVDQLQDPGGSRSLSNDLRGWLGSEKVCERVDDDKTLLLISRKT
jgi:hypothetical protein